MKLSGILTIVSLMTVFSAFSANASCNIGIGFSQNCPETCQNLTESGCPDLTACLINLSSNLSKSEYQNCKTCSVTIKCQ